ncbi:hypothetical protein MPSEU_000935700 [Mayamaea pseudoterrestris]|nr:hypothetical protein MPSEU_000935700 [Mayamaea pseudoterrestris]
MKTTSSSDKRQAIKRSVVCSVKPRFSTPLKHRTLLDSQATDCATRPNIDKDSKHMMVEDFDQSMSLFSFSQLSPRSALNSLVSPKRRLSLTGGDSSTPTSGCDEVDFQLLDKITPVNLMHRYPKSSKSSASALSENLSLSSPSHSVASALEMFSLSPELSTSIKPKTSATPWSSIASTPSISAGDDDLTSPPPLYERSCNVHWMDVSDLKGSFPGRLLLPTLDE